MSAPTLSAPAALVGSFTPDVFAAHLASLPPSLPPFGQQSTITSAGLTPTRPRFWILSIG